MPSSTQIDAAMTAADWLTRRPVFMDTETTGIGPQDEICEIAILEASGAPLLQTLVRPSIPIPASAYNIHGLTDADVRDAPTIKELIEPLERLLFQRASVIYNAAFDDRMIRQSLRAASISTDRRPTPSRCAMRLYARFEGTWNPQRGEYRWRTLDYAARQCHLSPAPAMHRAAADAETCRQLVLHMAATLPGKSGPLQSPDLAPYQPPLNI